MKYLLFLRFAEDVYFESSLCSRSWCGRAEIVLVLSSWTG